MWCECPYCERYFKYSKPPIWLAIEPTGKNYMENAVAMAKRMYSEYLNDPDVFEASERSIWDFYRLPFFKFKQEVEAWYERERPMPDKDSELYDGWKARRVQYLESPEAKFAYGLNFCAREGSGYRQLKAVLTGRVKSEGKDENDEYYPFSTTDEAVNIKRQWQLDGIKRDIREDAFTYFGKCSSVVSRILLSSVKGSSKFLPISHCPISVYFPEHIAKETKEIKKSESSDSRKEVAEQ